MSIGLYDQDFLTYVQVPFNLEIMKLAAYYKKHNEVVSFCPQLVLDKYSKFIIRKDYNDGNFINPYIRENLEYGGLAYTNGNYIPLAEDIESTAPDTHLYDKYRRHFATTLELGRAFNVMSRAEHLRLSLDGKNIWSPFMRQVKTLSQARCLFFHDPDLGAVEGAQETILKLTTKMNQSAVGRKIGSKFPILVKDEDDLLRWSKLWPTAEFYALQFNGIINDEAFAEFIEVTRHKTISDQLIYRVDLAASDENDFIKNKICQIYKQIIFSRRHKRRLLLKYDENFFIDKRWERLLRFFQCYHNTMIYNTEDITNGTLYDFALCIKDESNYSNKDIFLRQEVRELFQMVREQNYELFNLFYKCYNVSLIGGKLENDARTN